MKSAQPNFKSGIVPIVVILIVLAVSTAVVVFALRNYKGVASAENTAITACSADINGDGVVNSADLKAVSSQFGTKAGAPYDINGDGSVDILDISAAAKLIGQTCAKNAAVASQFACAADLNHDGIVNKPDLDLAADQIGKAGSADLNGDGVVNILDLVKIAQSYGQKCVANATSFCVIADANHDGVVDARDLQIISGDFGKKSPYDLDGDGIITIIDISRAASYIGQNCSSVSQSVSPALTPTPTPVATSSNPVSSSIQSPVPTPDTRIANWCNGSDVNHDGYVNLFDLQLVQKDYGKASKYDVDGDGIISIIDISRVNSNYGKSCKA